MRRNALYLLAAVLLLVSSACTENINEVLLDGSPHYYWPDDYPRAHEDAGVPDRDASFDVLPSSGAYDAAPTDLSLDTGLAGDAAVPPPQCSSFTTLQQAVCVSCVSAGASAPVVSCTAGAPTEPTCQELVVGSYTCAVCTDPQGQLTSQSCSVEAPCTTEQNGDQLCLVCQEGGVETFRKCELASTACKTAHSATEICLQCYSATGKLLSNQCVPVSLTCTSEPHGGQQCLVCRDAGGGLVSMSCPPAGGG